MATEEMGTGVLFTLKMMERNFKEDGRELRWLRKEGGFRQSYVSDANSCIFHIE